MPRRSIFSGDHGIAVSLRILIGSKAGSNTRSPHYEGRTREGRHRWQRRDGFWARTFARLFGGSGPPAREERLLAYIVHRLDKGARLDDVVREEYVRRQASSREVERIVSNPEIVTTARERMRRDLGSREMSSRGRVR